MDKATCVVCGREDEFDHACQSGWVPGVFVGNFLLGNLCGQCVTRYGVRGPQDEDGAYFDNDQVGNVALLFQEHPDCRDRLEKLSPQAKEFLRKVGRVEERG